MCGIGGIIRFDDRPIDPEIFVKMRRSMAHRGPDDYGHYISGSVGIANLRLSIIDIEGGHQPLFIEDGSVGIVYNGEVYNFRELRSQLKDYNFTTKSDTESILRAYQEWGLDALPRLNGMFAFAIWDRRRQRLLLARDRMGIKPLYYVCTRRYFAFASEIKALLSAGLIAPRVDRAALSSYLAIKYGSGSQTLFENVHHLMPGEWMSVSLDGRVEQGRYWSFELQPGENRKTETDLTAELRHLVEQSVRDQLVADVPVGAFLSGGIDSGIVVTEMARQTDSSVRAFTIDYDSAKRDQNEAHFARFTAKRAGALHTAVTCSEVEARRLLPLLVYYLDEPISEPLLAPSYLLARTARREVTVVLTGEGADELFAGYSRYRLSYWVDRLRRTPKFVRRSAYELAARFFGIQDVKTRVLQLSLNARSILNWYSVFTPTEIAAVTGGKLNQSAPQDESLNRNNGRSLLDSLLEMDSRFRLPEYILTRADKMTMANSLEMRPPLLDNRIVDFALRLPSDYKLRKAEDKYILRRAFEGAVAPEILSRPKIAFSAPYEGWLPTLCGEYLSDSHCAQAGLLARAELDRLLNDKAAYRGRRPEKLWTLVLLEIWFRVFVDGSLVPGPQEAASIDSGPASLHSVVQRHIA